MVFARDGFAVCLRRFSVVVILFTTVNALFAADSPQWPQFRGANGSGVAAAEAKPPIHFSPTNGATWSIEVPWSPSSPCVWKDRIFLTTFANGQLQTRAYDRRDGRELWASGITVDKLETFHGTDGSPAASTPATDGRHVISYFGSFGVICYDFQGKELWRHPLPVALSGGSYGSGTSPIIAGNRVLVNRDQDQNSSLLALDLDTGKTAWETARPDAVGGIGTPIIWENDGVPGLAFRQADRNQGGRGQARDPSSGRFRRAHLCHPGLGGRQTLRAHSQTPLGLWTVM
jgi:outer membrane protein assembly factor BamB